jgi:hypothetical protein
LTKTNSNKLINQIKSNQIKSNQIKSNQIKSNQIKSKPNFANNFKNQFKNQTKADRIPESTIRRSSHAVAVTHITEPTAASMAATHRTAAAVVMGVTARAVRSRGGSATRHTAAA